MVKKILTMLIRRALFLLFAGTALGEWLGSDITEFLLGDSFLMEFVSWAGMMGLTLWSVFDKILQSRREAIARDSGAGISKDRVAITVASEAALTAGKTVLLPSREQIKEAFKEG